MIYPNHISTTAVTIPKTAYTPQPEQHEHNEGHQEGREGEREEGRKSGAETYPVSTRTSLVPRALMANFLISRMARGARSLKVILCRRLCRLMV